MSGYKGISSLLKNYVKKKKKYLPDSGFEIGSNADNSAIYRIILIPKHFMKSVRIRIFSGPYSVRILENKDQKSSEYGLFSRSERVLDFESLSLRLIRSFPCQKMFWQAQITHQTQSVTFKDRNNWPKFNFVTTVI